MLHAADKLTPATLRRKRCLPYTPAFISAIKQKLNLDILLDAVVYTCLTKCFYTLARLGEFTVCTQTSFKHNKHIITLNLSYKQDRNNLKVTVLHLPSTKVASSEGEDVYRVKHTHCPLTKTKFLEKGEQGCTSSRSQTIAGTWHQNRINTQVPAGGIPFNMMKAKGHWAGDSFLLYLWKHTIIIAPYIQATPEVQDAFIHYMMPPVH